MLLVFFKGKYSVVNLLENQVLILFSILLGWKAC